MRLLFITFTLFIHLFGYETFIVKGDLQNFNSAPYTFYIQDRNNSFSAEDILNHKELKQLHKNGQLPNLMGPFWSRFEIKNNTNELKHLLLYNILPGTNHIDAYVYKDDALVKKYLLGDMRAQNTKEILSRYSIFELTLNVGESYTIVSKVDNYNIVNLSWVVSENNFFMGEESKKLIILGVNAGFFILFTILSTILFFIYKETAYLSVAAYITALSLYIFSVQGVLYNFNLGINLTLLSLFAWTLPSLSSSLFLLFTYQFFSIEERYKKFYNVMILLLILHGFNFILISYAVLVDETYIKYSYLTGSFSLLNAFYLLSAGIYMKEVGSKFYLVGQIVLIFAIVVSILGLYGIIPYYAIYRDLVTIALFIDIIFLLIAQTLKTKHQINLLNNSKVALIENSRYSSIGMAINNITHQWKHPLSHIGLSMLMIETILKNKKDSLIPTLEEELPKVTYSLNLMKKTIDEFSNYYAQDITKNDFAVKNSIEHVMHIFNSKTLLKKATFALNIDDKLIIL